MWVQSASKKDSFCLIILARVAADTLSAKTHPGKSHFVPGPPLSLYEGRVEVLINAREFENLKSQFVIFKLSVGNTVRQSDFRSRCRGSVRRAFCSSNGPYHRCPVREFPRFGRASIVARDRDAYARATLCAAR